VTNLDLRCCLLSVPADKCNVSALPALPPNAAWTAANGCNVPGGSVAQGTGCYASFPPGFIETGGFSFVCYPGVTNGWFALSGNDLTCTGEEDTRSAATVCPINAVFINA
jgi:hypothetical protein